MKNIFKVSFLSMSIALCFSCENLEDVNINPNAAEIGVVGVDRLITGVQLDFSTTLALMSIDITSKFVQQTEMTTYHWSYHLTNSNRGEDMWMAYFGRDAAGVRNLNYILEYASEANANYRGMALTLKAFMDYMLTSCYGDIPYSEGAKGKEGIVLAKYDKQEDVFKGILADLEEANTLLGTGTNSLKGDFLLGNDVMKWKKFANSLRVRVLIAQSKKIDPSAELKKIVGDPTTYPLMGSNTDQPVLAYNTSKRHARNHLSDYYMGSSYVTKTLVNKLVDYDDDRVKMFALKITGDTYTGDPYVGVPSGGAASGEASLLSAFLQLSEENFAVQEVWMHYAELEFLLAEAAQRGWIDGGAAKAESHYKKGIKASYEYQKDRQTIGLAGALVHGKADYSAEGKIDKMADFDDAYYEKSGVKYNAVPANNLQQIAEQKWIALYCNMENWFSYRRSGLPKLVVVTSGQPYDGVIPLRFKYPSDESAFNVENYKAAVAVQGPDEWDTKMWLLK